jgi:membrane-associated phospholipid phosphatase
MANVGQHADHRDAQGVEPRWHARQNWALAGLLLGVFCALGGWVSDHRHGYVGVTLDRPILAAGEHHADRTMRDVATAITVLGSYAAVAIAGALAAGWMLRRRDLRAAAFVIVAVAGAMALGVAAKLIVDRARPPVQYAAGTPTLGTSFPSAHSMNSLAFSVALVFVVGPTRWRYAVAVVAALLVVSVGASRVVLGVHYPSDVIGGWCLAAAWVIACHAVLGQSHRHGRARQAPARPR